MTPVPLALASGGPGLGLPSPGDDGFSHSQTCSRLSLDPDLTPSCPDGCSERSHGEENEVALEEWDKLRNADVSRGRLPMVC